MGNIRKRSKHTWTIQWDEPRGLDGRRHQRSKAIRGTRRDAEGALATIERQIRTGQYVEPTRETVAEYLEKWLDQYARSRVSPKTYQEYQGIIRNHLEPALGSTLLQQLTPMEVQTYYSRALESGRLNGQGGLAARTVTHHHALLHKALGQAVKWQLIPRNPIDSVDPPRVPQKEMKVLAEKDIPILVKEIQGTPLYIPVLIALGTGLRRGEIIGLTWTSIDLDGSTITVLRSIEQTKDGLRAKQPKTHRSRRPVRMPAFVVKQLRAHKAAAILRTGPDFTEDDYVCTREDGSLWPPDSLSHRFADVVHHLDVPQVRFHDLRHTFATLSLQQDVHPKVVSEMLGHSSINITLDTYSHVLPDMQDHAAARLDTVLRRAISGEIPRAYGSSD